jgi:hypothetical protein
MHPLEPRPGTKGEMGSSSEAGSDEAFHPPPKKKNGPFVAVFPVGIEYALDVTV